MSEDALAELEADARAAALSAARATPADLERIAELLRTPVEGADSSFDGSSEEVSHKRPVARDGPVVAGLRLRWREFRGRRAQNDGSDGGEITFGVWVVVDDLAAMLRMVIEDETQGPEKRMPYFGIVWPSGAALVAKMLAGPPLKGKTVLDLGCGLGECGFAAAALGARVTFFDWEPRAIEIVKATAALQEGPHTRFTFVVGDWRTPPPRFGTFDLILGADLLYEQSSPAAVAAFIAKHLKPGAEAWMTDPGRPQAWPFIDRSMDHGLELLRREALASQQGVPGIALLRFRRPMVGARSGIRGRI